MGFMRSLRPAPHNPLTSGAWRRCLASVVSMSLALVAAGGCSRSSARLAPEVEQRLTAEGIVRRADDSIVRRTHGLGTRRSGWEEMTVSIIVTRRRVLIHDNAKTLVEVEGGSGARARVSRDHDRVTLRLGGERSATSWSFHPPDDAPGWTADLRAAL